jgi:hypothetical protein
VGKFIIATFLLLGWGFYELSGGSEFTPEAWPEQADATLTITDAPLSATVSRSETTTLNLTPAVTQISLETTTQPEVSATPAVVEELVVAVEEPAVEAEPTPVASALDLRAVAGSRVNMREGPGTNYGVIDTLTGGTEAEVIEVNADGWARIRLIGTNQTGWMAERLLNPI